MRLFLISAGSLTASMFVCWFFWVFAGMFRKGYLRWKEWNYVFSTRDDCRPGSSLPEWKIIKSLEEKGEHTKHCVWYLTSRGRDERFYTPGVEKVIASSWRRVPYIWTLVMWYFIIHSLLGVLKFCRNMVGFLWLDVWRNFRRPIPAWYLNMTGGRNPSNISV
jgi:hypothetical protein